MLTLVVSRLPNRSPGRDAESLRGLAPEDLSVVFQPIVDMRNGRTFAFEALVRCKDPRYPTPPRLFEAAIEEGACGWLGRSIREIAFRTCGDNKLFVNLHPQELTSRWLVKPDDPIGFHDRPVYLEITEASAFEHFELCMGVLKELCRRTGAYLVVDDFGAGYSNLERVADLAPAVVKLDMALTRDIHNRKARQIIVRHVVGMCTELGAVVVGEGVETIEELHCLRDLGVCYAQGYLLARPGSPPPQPRWPPSPAPPPSSRGTKPPRSRTTKPAIRR
jgi:EAL domain-containing protein (putative c-di-GMP-specific phosphodiesterase class I)